MAYDLNTNIVSYRQTINGKSRRIKRSPEETAKAYRLLKTKKCNICEQPEPMKNRRLSLDHNHKTGKLRGVLCSTCNRALGMLKDDPKRLARLLVYLLES